MIMKKIIIAQLLLVAALLLLATVAVAQVPPPADADSLSGLYQNKTYSPYAGRDFPDRPLWGDSHLHTAMSMDAGAFGNRLGLDDAYRFARGEEVVSATQIPVRLSRPLDWLVVADLVYALNRIV